MLNVSNWSYVSFFIYLGAMLGIGIYFYFYTKTMHDFVLGGRRLGAWVTAMSAFASDMSGWLLMGLPGLAYATGLMEPFWCMLGLVIGSFINWMLVARRLRRYTENIGDSLTLSDYFEKRFLDHSKLLRTISSFFIIFYFTIYTSAQFVAGAKLFESVLGLNYQIGLLVMVGTITTYIFLGGFLAVCWTDFFQGLLMLVALIIVPLVAIHGLFTIDATSAVSIGATGVTGAIGATGTIASNMLSIFSDSKGTPITLLLILSSMAWGLGYMGQPHILVRFMGIESSNKLMKAATIATTWTVISMLMAIVVGLVGIPFVKAFGAYPGFESERIFILLISKTMHPLIGGFMLAAILAAAQSTASSQLLVASSSLVEDFFRLFFKGLKNKDNKDKSLVWINRFALIFIMLISAIISNNPQSSVLKIVSYAWGGLGASLGPMILFSLYWKRMTRNGALVGMIVGGVTIFIWKNMLAPLGGFFTIYELLPAFILSSLAIVIVSLLDEKPSPEIENNFVSGMKD
ncbi:MAG: sodium/proline symporter PutP [Oligoflexia bacterium]|nr:sodium/proline symporter PutP [Oligoflexia bacterium]